MFVCLSFVCFRLLVCGVFVFVCVFVCLLRCLCAFSGVCVCACVFVCLIVFCLFA